MFNHLTYLHLPNNKQMFKQEFHTQHPFSLSSILHKKDNSC